MTPDSKRVRRVHYGNGPAAELAAGLDDLRRANRMARARAWGEEEARRQAADALTDRLGNAAELMSEAALTRAGYHRHDRGSWRRRRMTLDGQDTTTDPVQDGGTSDVLASAERGDRSALPALRALLDADPRLWRRWGDLAAHARGAWVGVVAGTDLVVAESLTRNMEALGGELAGPSPTPLERLLVDRVVAGWLQTHHADAAYALAGDRDLTPAQFDHLQKRQERAQRSYLAAIKSLAVVRRLIPPLVSAVPGVGSEAAVAAEPTGVDQGRPARPGSARPGPSRKGHRRPSKTAPKGRQRPEREAVIPEPLRKRLRGMVGSKN